VACHKELQGRTERSSLIRGGAVSTSLPFADKRRACADCHADPHGGQFLEVQAGACERCHDVAAFRPASRFDHDRDAAFPLGAAHRSVACERCHLNRSGPDSRQIVTYRGVPKTCRDCHGPNKVLQGGAS